MNVTDAFLKALQEDVNTHFRPKVEAMQEKVAHINPKPAISKRIEEARAWLILDWLARGVNFVWLERAGFEEQRERLRPLRAVTRETAHDAFGVLTIFDTEIIMPILQAGRVDAIEVESQRIVELEQQCGVFAAADFHVNAAIQGTEMAKMFDVTTNTASRIVSACIQKSIRDRSLDGTARTLHAVERIERSIEPLVEKLLAVR